MQLCYFSGSQHSLSPAQLAHIWHKGKINCFWGSIKKIYAVLSWMLQLVTPYKRKKRQCPLFMPKNDARIFLWTCDISYAFCNSGWVGGWGGVKADCELLKKSSKVDRGTPRGKHYWNFFAKEKNQIQYARYKYGWCVFWCIQMCSHQGRQSFYPIHSQKEPHKSSMSCHQLFCLIGIQFSSAKKAPCRLQCTTNNRSLTKELKHWNNILNAHFEATFEWSFFEAIESLTPPPTLLSQHWPTVKLVVILSTARRCYCI